MTAGNAQEEQGAQGQPSPGADSSRVEQLNYSPPAEPSLGQKTSRGLAWMVFQTLVGKIASVGGQIVLARLLDPKDFGLVAMAYAVAAFSSVIRDAGLSQILIYRHKNFRRWAGTIFWMSLAASILSSFLLAVAAPIAERLENAPGLTGLILVLAAAGPITGLATVPSARISADLWYRFQAILGLGVGILTTVLNIAFAYWGFGAYSFILPFFIVNCLRTGVLWVATGQSVPMRFHFRRWGYLLGDSGALVAASAVGMVVSQGDYLTLGHLKDAGTVGIFYFAFNLSMQTLALLTVNLQGLLFPALNKLGDDPLRQIEAFLRAVKVFIAIAAPFCFLQAVLSDPGIRLIFNSKWYPSIPVLQVLSIAMVFRTAAMSAMSLAAAQNRLRFNLIFGSAGCVGFIGSVALGAWLGGIHAATMVAFAELIYFALSDSLYLYLLLRQNARRLHDVVSVLTAPLVCSTCAAIAASLAIQPIHSVAKLALLVKLAVGTVVMVLVYAALLKLISRKLWQELTSRLKAMRG